jgi:hypothetical protein
MIEEYLNYDHGLELTKGNTSGHRGNENGILFLAEYFVLKQISGENLTEEDKQIFTTIMSGLQVKAGLYDRGKSDKDRENPKRTISHDNISAISSCSVMFNTNHAKDIAVYGLKHFFVYNNNLNGFRLPMNPANYSIWLANGKICSLLEIIFLPFFLINFIITMSKAKETTSSKLLYLVELFPHREGKIHWKLSYKLYTVLLKRQYGENYLQELFSTYFKDTEHPNNILARKIYGNIN